MLLGKALLNGGEIWLGLAGDAKGEAQQMRSRIRLTQSQHALTTKMPSGLSTRRISFNVFGAKINAVGNV